MSKRKVGYMAIFFAPDGEWVIDYRGRRTIEEVWNDIANRGSRWFFYPYSAVIVDYDEYPSPSQRLVDVCDILTPFKGKTISEVSKILRNYHSSNW